MYQLGNIIARGRQGLFQRAKEMARKTANKERLTAQTALLMTPEMHKRVGAAARAAGHGIGEEIRSRLAASFEAEGTDPETTEILAVIKKMAATAEANLGPWHKDPFAWATFRDAVTTLLGRKKPPGEAVAKFKEGHTAFAELARSLPEPLEPLGAAIALLWSALHDLELEEKRKEST